VRGAVSILALLGACCNDRMTMTAPDAASPVFELHVWVNWDVMYAHDVTLVVIDGYTIPSGTPYQLDEWYTSYAAALAEFRPRAVSFTTALGTTTETISPLGDCPQLCAACAMPVKQEIFYEIQALLPTLPSQFGADQEWCTDITGAGAGWATR